MMAGYRLGTGGTFFNIFKHMVWCVHFSSLSSFGYILLGRWIGMFAEGGSATSSTVASFISGQDGSFGGYV